MANSVQLKGLREKLKELSVQPLPDGKTLRESEQILISQWRDLVPDKPLGKQLYESYPDEELIEILREAYRRLGRTPVQKDIFCFYRTYIKHRFVTWTGALRASGLVYSLDHRGCLFSDEDYAGIYREEAELYALLICLFERRIALGYPPRRKDFPGNELLKERFRSWNTALYAAEGMDRWLRNKNNLLKENVTFLTPEEQALLDEIRKAAKHLGRTPVKKEVCEETRSQLRIRFGSWDSVLHAAGLTPLKNGDLEHAEKDFAQRKNAGSDKLHRIKDLEPEYALILHELMALSRLLGRTPLKEEFDAEKRLRLQTRCGSWRNALYQIGLEALSKKDTAGIKQKKRRLKRYHLQK